MSVKSNFPWFFLHQSCRWDESQLWAGWHHSFSSAPARPCHRLPPRRGGGLCWGARHQLVYYWKPLEVHMERSQGWVSLQLVLVKGSKPRNGPWGLHLPCRQGFLIRINGPNLSTEPRERLWHRGKKSLQGGHAVIPDLADKLFQH